MSTKLHFLPSRQDLSLNLDLSCRPVRCVSAPHSAGVTGMHSAMAGFPHGFWVLSLMSCLDSRLAYTLSPLPSLWALVVLF